MASINNLTAVYADKFYLASSTGVSEISDTYATKTEVENLNFATDITANTDAIAVLNTKQLQNFNNINAINDDLTNNYQTNTVLATNFYNKTEIDTTLSNYYTSTQIDTNLSTNYQNNTLLATNFYNKSEIDANNWIDATALTPYVLTSTLTTDYYTITQTQANYYDKTYIDANIGGGGYSDTDIDNLLALRVPLSDFTNRFSANPIIDCSAPTVIHSGLTLNNSTINISPVAGLLFSNETGGGDKVLAEFKNATSYITLQGDKIFCNNTSDDAIKHLDLTSNGAGYKMSGKIEAPTGLTVENTTDGNLSFTVRNTDNYITFNNDSIDSYNSSDDTGRILNLNKNANEYVKSHSLLVDTASNTLTAGYTLDVVDSAIIRQNLRVDNNIDLTNSSGEIQLPTTGIDMFRDTGDANYNLRVRDTQGVFEFRNRNFRCMNPSNPANGTEMILHDTGGDYRMRIGSTSTATVGIGRQYNFSYHLTVGGISNFNETRVENDATFLGQQLIDTKSRVFQRADANNSLNIIGEKEINFSLQTTRGDDPTTSSIAMQLNDNPSSITLNRAVTNNLTFNSIGKITAEADLDVWGGVYFQHSSAIKETLNGSDYDLDIRNGDTDRAINFIIGTIGSTPELQLTDGKVSLLGNLEKTHDNITGQQKVLINNPDDNGWIRLSNNNLSTLDATTTGVDVYGDLSYTGSLIPSSDKRLKKDIKEVDSKKAVELIKYIKPKTYHFIDDRQQGKSCVGFIANDFMETKKMPDEWQNVVKEGKDGYLKFDYTTCVPILWSALQTTISEIDKLKKELNKLKKNKSDSDDALASSGRSRD